MKNHKSRNQVRRLQSVLCLVAMLAGSLAVSEAQCVSTVEAWGNNANGQTNVPAGLSNVVAIAGSGNHSLALRSDGTVVAWGANYSGQTNVPAGLSNVIAIAGGRNHTLAVRADGTVFAWGDNYYGQTEVPAGLSNVIAAAGGLGHSLALRSDGRVVAWGYNSDGQTNVPAAVSNVIAIVGGDYHSTALRSDGRVVAWGHNSYGQTNVPVSLSNVIAIAGGYNHSLALRSDGKVVAWGYNSSGKLNVPASLSNVVAIAGGGRHSLALKSDGTVVAWGDNANGQTNVPTGLGPVVAIAAGGSHSLAVSGGPLRVLVASANSTVAVGRAAQFRTVVLGLPPLAYQWFFDETNSLSGASGPVLQLTDVQPAQAGNYTVVVTNAYGSVTSSPVKLTVVGTPPVIVAQPGSRAYWPGFNLDLSVEVAGSLPMAYQWWSDSSTIHLGETNAILHFVNLQPSQAGAYSVVVTNAFGAVTSTPAILTLVSSNTVPETSEALLRAALATGVSPVTFACTGMITLSSTITIGVDTVLDGSGHEVTLSGGNAVRVLSVNTNIALTLVNLTIANGRSIEGAAVFNQGTLRATNCLFVGNLASNVSYTALVGAGGAVYNAGTFVASRSTFLQNQAKGYLPAPGPERAYAHGGAVCNVGALAIDSSVFICNSAIGLYGGDGANAIFSGGGGRGGMGGSGYGGALFNAGVATLVNSTIASNTCTGGGGGRGGDGPYTMHGVERIYLGPGGSGGEGGSGLGSGIYSVGYPVAYGVMLTNCTVAFNSATGGVGGGGGGGSPPGGTGANGTAGGSLQSGSTSLLINDIFAANSPSNCSGTITDLGHNLSSDASPAFTNGSSLKNTDPQLGPLADNGGPTLTMALLPGSPAIDAADTASAPTTDQRGFPRPAGLAADIGAFEFGSMLPVLAISRSGATEINILVNGNAGQWWRLLTSTDLSDWQCVATNQIGADGTALFQDNCGTGETQRFYKVALP